MTGHLQKVILPGTAWALFSMVTVVHSDMIDAIWTLLWGPGGPKVPKTEKFRALL